MGNVMRRAGGNLTVLPGTRAEALRAASGDAASAPNLCLAREIGQSIALLAFTGVSVGGVHSVVVIAARVLGR
jgi:hypothetical protein